MSDGHIYTLNHNVKQLEQNHEELEERITAITASSDYVVKEDAQARIAKMIDSIDDILKIAREIPKPKPKEEKPIISLIHRKDNLTDLLYELINAGYSPGINFEAGRLASLNMEFNGVFYGVVAVEDEATYNNMNQSMTSLNDNFSEQS